MRGISLVVNFANSELMSYDTRASVPPSPVWVLVDAVEGFLILVLFEVMFQLESSLRASCEVTIGSNSYTAKVVLKV